MDDDASSSSCFHEATRPSTHRDAWIPPDDDDARTVRRVDPQRFAHTGQTLSSFHDREDDATRAQTTCGCRAQGACEECARGDWIDTDGTGDDGDERAMDAEECDAFEWCAKRVERDDDDGYDDVGARRFDERGETKDPGGRRSGVRRRRSNGFHGVARTARYV